MTDPTSPASQPDPDEPSSTPGVRQRVLALTQLTGGCLVAAVVVGVVALIGLVLVGWAVIVAKENLGLIVAVVLVVLALSAFGVTKSRR